MSAETRGRVPFRLLMQCISRIETKYIRENYGEKPSMYTCMQLLNSNNKRDIIGRGKYTYSAFKMRDSRIVSN